MQMQYNQTTLYVKRIMPKQAIPGHMEELHYCMYLQEAGHGLTFVGLQTVRSLPPSSKFTATARRAQDLNSILTGLVY